MLEYPLGWFEVVASSAECREELSEFQHLGAENLSCARTPPGRQEFPRPVHRWPMAAMLLADQGSDVIRVEPPGGPRWGLGSERVAAARW